MLHRPRGGAGAAPRGSIASRFTAGTALGRAETHGTSRSRDADDDGGLDGKYAGPHPVEPRASTAMLPPVLTKAVDADPLAWLEFTEEAIMTSCKSGTLLYSHSSPPPPSPFVSPLLCSIPHSCNQTQDWLTVLAQRTHPDLDSTVRYHGPSRRDFGELDGTLLIRYRGARWEEMESVVLCNCWLNCALKAFVRALSHGTNHKLGIALSLHFHMSLS